MSHTLLAPNGLGVYGGKAKLLYECGGMPGAFLESAGGKAFQPSYPPGMALLACLHSLLSGGCGDRLVQLIAAFAVASVCFAMLRGTSNVRTALPVALFCLSPVAVRMTSGFYAEPFAALMLLLGWDMAGRGKRIRGALGLGGLSDWDFCAMPRLGQVAYAAWSEVKALGLLVVPVAATICLALPVGRQRFRSGPTTIASLPRLA